MDAIWLQTILPSRIKPIFIERVVPYRIRLIILYYNILIIFSDMSENFWMAQTSISLRTWYLFC